MSMSSNIKGPKVRSPKRTPTQRAAAANPRRPARDSSQGVYELHGVSSASKFYAHVVATQVAREASLREPEKETRRLSV